MPISSLRPSILICSPWGNLTLHWGLQMTCFSPAVSRRRNISFPFPWGLQGHLQAERAQHDTGVNFLGFSTGAGCLRHCSDAVHLPSTPSIIGGQERDKKSSVLEFLRPWDRSKQCGCIFSNLHCAMGVNHGKGDQRMQLVLPVHQTILSALSFPLAGVLLSSAGERTWPVAHGWVLMGLTWLLQESRMSTGSCKRAG